LKIYVEQVPSYSENGFSALCNFQERTNDEMSTKMSSFIQKLERDFTSSKETTGVGKRAESNYA
jgi:hypothetical protein